PDKTADVNLISTHAKFDMLTSVSNGAYLLAREKDYSVFENALYIKKEYLCTLKTGSYNLTFTFADGKMAVLALNIIDTTPYKPPVRPVSISLEPRLLILPHASQYDLNLIKLTVKYEDGSVKYPDTGIAWKVSRGGGTITENIYRPVSEDFEQLECTYTPDGFEPVYNYLTVSYSDQKIVPVVKILSENITAGNAVYFDASESIGGDMYEWLFDFSNLSNSSVESDIVKYWSGDSKTSHTYKKGGVYKLILKVKNSDNHNYIKSSPPLNVGVKPLPPVAAPEGGIYNAEQIITLTAGEEVTKIIYTLDGSEPSMTDSNIYTAPFKIKKTVQLKATAVVEENEKTAMIASDTITINYKMNNSAIYPAFVEFDKNKPGSAEIEIKIEPNGNTLENISYKDYTLNAETDYHIVNDVVILSRLFLKTIEAGQAELVFNFSAGEPQILKLEIFESAVFNSTIIPVRANFDKGINQADIHVTLILNGNELNYIKKGDYQLKAGTDYIRAEERIVLKKEYLLTLPFGESGLDFNFNAGENATLTLNVYQSYIIVEPVKNPEFSFNAGTYFETLSVSITCATAGAAIKYTTDGSEPSQSNGLTYTAPIEVLANATIKAVAFKGGMVNSQVVSNEYIIILPVANPEFIPEGGTYYYDQIVSITCITPDALIKYTLDGSIPSQINGILYSTPITISQTSTVKAVAYKSGFSDSAVVTAEYIMLPPPQPRTEPPQFTPAAGTYAEPQTVTLTCATAGATIKYTLNGSDPTDKNGTTYRNPFIISTSTLVKAVAFKRDMADSNIVSASYEILPPAANPQFTPQAGAYAPGLSVTITCATEGATVKYTLDGSDPSLVNGFQYSAPVIINQTTTIKAIAVKAGIRDSQIVSAVYEILAPVADPQFTPAAGTYAEPQTVTLTCATAGATIKYTLNGSDPTDKNGTTYRNPFIISTSTLVKAVAFKRDMADSNIVSASYEILPPAANPQFTPQAGAYAPGLSVTITCATEGATVKYTLDGSDPSLVNGFQYSAPVIINQTTTIKAIAVKAGIRDSQIVSAVYEILAPVEAPQFTPAAGTYSGEQTIKLTTTTKNANIKYTLDGTDPSPSNGIIYKKSFVITESKTIKAYAYKSGLPDSQIVTAEYIITP
ncbi:MAG TPA: chitobiase/beta-hexosaminidase C-terminal domain-containing protein, partial [Candidatus Wallbacteria bacterium]|nr:chitobiase/beta-hexosaminidase C-terminal domain-containing protein [Candidatus Wallbacteria bacterium]